MLTWILFNYQQELLKSTPKEHPDYSQILHASNQLREFTMNVNESVRETENIRRFAELVKDQKKYIGFEVNTFLSYNPPAIHCRTDSLTNC